MDLSVSVFETISVAEFLGYFDDTIRVSESIAVVASVPYSPSDHDSITVGETVTAVTDDMSVSTTDTVSTSDTPTTAGSGPTISVNDVLGIGDSGGAEVVLQAVVFDTIGFAEGFDYDYTKYATQVIGMTHPGSGSINIPSGRTW